MKLLKMKGPMSVQVEMISLLLREMTMFMKVPWYHHA